MSQSRRTAGCAISDASGSVVGPLRMSRTLRMSVGSSDVETPEAHALVAEPQVQRVGQRQVDVAGGRRDVELVAHGVGLGRRVLARERHVARAQADREAARSRSCRTRASNSASCVASTRPRAASSQRVSMPSARAQHHAHSAVRFGHAGVSESDGGGAPAELRVGDRPRRPASAGVGSAAARSGSRRRAALTAPGGSTAAAAGRWRGATCSRSARAPRACRPRTSAQRCAMPATRGEDRKRLTTPAPRALHRLGRNMSACRRSAWNAT